MSISLEDSDQQSYPATIYGQGKLQYIYRSRRYINHRNVNCTDRKLQLEADSQVQFAGVYVCMFEKHI